MLHSTGAGGGEGWLRWVEKWVGNVVGGAGGGEGCAGQGKGCVTSARILAAYSPVSLTFMEDFVYHQPALKRALVKPYRAFTEP
jgi:hypothetical protein